MLMLRLPSRFDPPLPLLITGISGVAGYNALPFFQRAYPGQVIGIEVLNVRRPGKAQGKIPAAEMKDLGDELARYMLGVDDDFGKRLQKT